MQRNTSAMTVLRRLAYFQKGLNWLCWSHKSYIDHCSPRHPIPCNICLTPLDRCGMCRAIDSLLHTYNNIYIVENEQLLNSDSGHSRHVYWVTPRLVSGHVFLLTFWASILFLQNNRQHCAASGVWERRWQMSRWQEMTSQVPRHRRSRCDKVGVITVVRCIGITAMRTSFGKILYPVRCRNNGYSRVETILQREEW